MRCFLDGLLDSVVVLLPAFRLFASFAIGTDCSGATSPQQLMLLSISSDISSIWTVLLGCFRPLWGKYGFK